MSENVTGGVLRDLWSGAVETLRSYWTGTYSSRDPAAAEALGLGPTSTGIHVNADSAFNSSAFWSAVSIISCDVASLPLEQFKRSSKDENAPYVDSKTYELVHNNPNDEMTSIVMRETMQGWALTWGNGHAEIERDGAGRPYAIWPMTPNRVTPFRQDRRVKYRITNASEKDTFLEARDVLHVPGLGFDGLNGYSVIEKARESIGMGLAMQRFGGTFFGNGSTFGGVLAHPGNLTKEVKQGIRESIEAVHGGVDRAHKFVILGGGMTYTKLGIPPNDAQFLESRRFEIEEIARWFHMPQHKLNGLDHATFSNIEHLDLEYYKSCLRGWLVRWEQELNRKLIAPLERRSQWFKHNVEGFLRGDSVARADFYTKQFGIGAMSINDILALENRNGIGPDGDVRFVPANMMPLDRALNPPAPPAPALPIVTEVKPKELAPKRDDDPADESLRELLSEIAANTAALQASMAAEREAMSHAERERHAAEVEALRAEAVRLTQRLDEERAAAVEDRTAWRVEVDKTTEAQRVIERERKAREDAEADLLAARTAAEALAAAQQAAEAQLVEAAAGAAHTLAIVEGIAAAAAVDAAAQAREERERAALEVASVREAQDVAEKAAVALSLKLGKTEQRVEAAEQAVKDAAATLLAQRAAETERLSGMVAAHRALIVDAWGRMVRRETEKARRHQATAEKLRSWAEAFYVTHEDTCVEALRPAVRAHLAWKQSTEDVDAVTLALVQAHIADSVRQVRALVDGTDAEELSGALERMLQKWEQHRPEALADRVLKDELDYVRSVR